MKMCFIIRPYCTGSERSRPNSCLTAAIVSGVGLRPASCRAGSTPGVAKKMTKVRTVIAKSTTTRPISLLTMKTVISEPLALDAELGAGVERVADAVAEQVQREHGEHDEDPGHDRHQRPRVEQRLPVVDDRAPTRLRR